MPYPIFIKSNVWHKEGVIINFHRLWVLAQAELGYTLKTKRYRSFLGYVYVAATIVYLMSSALHAFFSAFTATISVGSPSYMIGTVGVVSLSIYGIGIIFMGFDIRARDVRENIVEVLDCRPYYNSELVLGRFLGLFLSTWIPIVLLAFFLEILGFLLPLVGSPIGGSIELLSLITYSVFMAVPSIAFCLSLVFLITISLRHRLFATIISVAALVLLIAATFKLPASYVALVDFTGAAQMKHPSELVHSVAKASAWLQRLGVLALAFGLLGLTMLLHPRLDDNRYKLQGMFAITGCVLGIFLLSFNSIQHQNLLKHQAQWREAHQARLNEPAVDIRTVKGSITLFPGDLLTANLELVVTAPPHQSLAQPLFTLNPGLKVQKVSNDDGEKLAFDHHNGLLDIKLSKPMAAGEQRRLTLIYKGRPNENFGYLDSAINTDNLSFREAQAGKVLGFERVVFDSRYIALLPGTAWFPLPGADVARDDMQRRSKDFFNLDLTVEVPANWLVAGPGKRYKLETKEKRTKFRFAPDISIAEVPLLASAFTAYSTTLSGIEFEALLYPAHTSNLDILSAARPQLESWVQDHLTLVQDSGLKYPFKTFTLVEVPNALRGYGGGWRQDTTMAPPSMLLLRESGFPTARFDFYIGKSWPTNRQGTLNEEQANKLRDRVVGFFNGDLSGGDVFAGIARSYFKHQTAVSGEDAIALDFALQELTTLVLSGKRGYFSAYRFLPQYQNAFLSFAGNMFTQADGNVSGVAIDTFVDRPEVWEAIMSTPLHSVALAENSQRSIDQLYLKAGELAQMIYDSLGPRDAGKFLAQILRRHHAGTFTLDDVIAAGNQVSKQLGPVIAAWFEDTGLPGFVVDKASFYELAQTTSGDRQYQLLVTLRNDESTPGFARVSWTLGNEEDSNRYRSKPLHIGARSSIQYAAIFSQPIDKLYIEPYLSLNRQNFSVQKIALDRITRKSGVQAISGVIDAPWKKPENGQIIIDDLDQNFSITKTESTSLLRLGASRIIDLSTDQGLPVGIDHIAANTWSRKNLQSSWGKYRRTIAYTSAGSGDSAAVFTAELPQAGSWKLELHLPSLKEVAPLLTFGQTQRRGTWQLSIESTGLPTEVIHFDAADKAEGWAIVGEYQLPAGKIRLVFSDKTDGNIVIADAIRWSPGNSLTSDR